MRRSYLAEANKIPELGHGGKSTKSYLYSYAQRVPENGIIIDVGPFLGSTTGYLMAGLMDAGRRARIFSFDKWEADAGYCEKAKNHLGLTLREGSSLLPLFLKNVRRIPFPSGDLSTVKGDIFKTTWDKDLKISLAVFDPGNGRATTEALMRTFSPAFIPGKTIIFFMDFYFYETHTPADFNYQHLLVDKNAVAFEFVERCSEPSRCAIYRWYGGELEFDV